MGRQKYFSCLWVMPGVRDKSRGWIVAGSMRYPCALGAGGVLRQKREGDGATPCGDLAVLGGYYRGDRILYPANGLGLSPIRTSDGWCDDPADGRYNRPVRLPFAAGHEKMARVDHLYDVVVVLDWNISRRSRGMGSAIFFHLAHDDYRPTEGCIAVSADTMKRLLPLIRAGTVFRVRDA